MESVAVTVTASTHKPWYKSRKVWGSAIAALVGLLSPQLGIPLSASILAVVSLLTGVAAEGVADAVGAAASRVQEAAKESK